MDLTLFCYVVGSGEQACAVDILSSRTVAHLKEKIWEKMTITSKANQLLLFKASFPSGDDVAKQAKNAIEGFEPLDPTEKLSTIFSGEPPEKTVHIVAKLPDDIIPKGLSLETQLFKAYSIIDVDVDSFSSKPLCDEASVENYAKLYKDSDTGEEVNLIKEQVRKLEARRVVPALFCDPQLLHSAKERMSSETWNENYVDASSLGSEEKLYEMSKTELTTLLHMELELDNILNMQISKTLSSAIRETHFCSLFNLPVARARWNMPSPWEYQQEKSNQVTMVLRNRMGEYAKYSPISDFCWRSKDLRFAFLIGKVDSNLEDHADQWRMVAQLTVLSRLAAYALKREYPKRREPFLVLGVYVTATLDVTHFWAFSKFSKDDETKTETHILMKEYPLQKHRLATAMLLARTYNNLLDEYIDESVALSSSIDSVKQWAKGLPTITSQNRKTGDRKTGDRKRKRDDNDENPGREGQPAGPGAEWVMKHTPTVNGVFLGKSFENVEEALKATGSRTLDQYPHVKEYIDNHGRVVGYSKVVNEEELSIIKILQQDPVSHRYFGLPVNVRELEAVYIYEGYSLNRQVDQVAKFGLVMAVQLLHCVTKLHMSHIAHLDIKPGNLVWNPDTLTLKLIDFSCSIFQEDHTALYDDIKGTPGYRDPLIAEGEYNPYKADAWAVGSIILQILAEIDSEEKEENIDLVCALWAAAMAMKVCRTLPEDASAHVSFELQPGSPYRQMLDF